MQLSICIPTYCFDPTDLITSLRNEINTKKLDAEIIVIDDASDAKTKNILIKNQVQLDFLEFLNENLGRSAIRNRFLQFAKGEYMLFLDGDGKVLDSNFIQIYLDLIDNVRNVSVVYGGRKVQDFRPDDSHFLRWKFATERENLPLKSRLRNPYLGFQTNNFIIKKDVFSKNLFNEKLNGYGYEDILFSMDLKKNSVFIHHIDNPILNNDIETNIDYLEKVDSSIFNISFLLKSRSIRKELRGIKLVRAYLFLEKMGMTNVFLRFMSGRIEKISKALISGKAPLLHLDLYKLFYLTKAMK